MTFVGKEAMQAKQVEPGLFGRKLIDGAQGARGVSLVSGWLEPGARHSPHTHEIEEAVVFVGGRGMVVIAEREHQVGPGDAVHIAAGVVHSTVNTGNEDLSFVAAFADNLVASDPLRIGGGTVHEERGIGVATRHRISWLLRKLADRLVRRR